MMGGYDQGVYSPAKAHKRNQSHGQNTAAYLMKPTGQSAANLKDPMSQSSGVVSPYVMAERQEEKKQHWNEIIKNKEV